MKKGLRNTWFKLIIVSVLSVAIFSCDNESSEQKIDQNKVAEIEAKLDEVDSKRAVLVESIIRSAPTLAETSEIFAELGSSFQRAYLNDIKNVNNYTTLKDQGINLGIYLADLAYIATYEQSQEVIFYMNTAQKLAEGIGVHNVFDEKTVERMEMNINDKDSIVMLISEMYWKTDQFLKELNRENISALIICGGWIEGMSIGSKMIADGHNDDVIYEKMLSQQSNLKKLITLLKTFEGDENIDFIEERLVKIDSEFSTLPKREKGPMTQAQKDTINTIAQNIVALRAELNQS